ncbi:MAG: PIN domain-containing protein [Candidatus Competibacteraceae bacterium]|jgi:predicted nucleic acid-binding protein|nr:MAG: PIN domain-containing protein [Candidatus Competibacteraceae bacterium]
MNAEKRAYLDTSALAKWYLNEPGSEDFVLYIQDLDVAVISSLTQTEMRSLLARRRRMGELNHELESVVYASFLDDITQGSLQLYSVEDARFAEAVNLIARYPEHPLRTLDALHLAVARHWEVESLATADAVMAGAAASMGFAVRRF